MAKFQSLRNPASPVDQKSILMELTFKLNTIGPLQQLVASQKKLNINISKYPKLLEKSFNPGITKAYRNDDFDYHNYSRQTGKYNGCNEAGVAGNETVACAGGLVQRISVPFNVYCPVSRDRGSEENPPMLMLCGHVMFKQLIVKLSKSSTRTFRCSCRPSEASVGQCRQLHF